MRLPRLTTRRLMVLVAVVALALGIRAGAIRLEQTRLAYSQQAATHGAPEAEFRRIAAMGRGFDGVLLETATGPLRTLEEILSTAEQESRLKQKYLRAARYPWLPVPP